MSAGKVNCRSLLLPIILGLFLVLISNNIYAAQNIVSNSGFEVGKPGELPDEWRDQKERGAEGQVSITDREAHSGKQCLLIEHTNAGGYIHPNKSVEIKPGDYVFSFWTKSEKEIQFPAQIYRETDWSMILDELITLKPGEWKKFEFPVSMLETIPGSIQIGLTVPGRLWLDDVELNKIGTVKTSIDVQAWDTVSPFAGVENKKDWEYLPNGTQPLSDLVLENGYLIAAFSSKDGKVIILSNSGEKLAEIAPLEAKGKNIEITDLKILQNTKDEVIIKVSFSAEDFTITFSIGKYEIVQINPSGKGISVYSSISYALVPSLISDELIFDPADYELDTLHIPSENSLIGLLNGENSMIMATWPDGNQKVRINAKDRHLFTSIDIESDQKVINLAILEASGIWHEEELKRTYLEKDISINWKRPFPAKWVTQLYEDGVKTTYTFRSAKRERFWRAGMGRYTYPVWFEGETAFFRLGKKIPPKEKSLIYFLERQGTSVSISTPVDILRRTLDSEIYERIIDSDGRRTRSSNPPGRSYDAATCATTDRIRAIFEAGEEVKKKGLIAVGTEDMTYFMNVERGRAAEYRVFAHEMLEFLEQMKKDKPQLKDFLDEMEEITREILDVYKHEEGNIGDIEYTKSLSEETKALAQQKRTGNLEAFLKLKGKWTAMGGAVEDLNRGLHTATRKLFQKTGYGCVETDEAVEVAQEIRKRIVKCLRKPSSYEIWSDY